MANKKTMLVAAVGAAAGLGLTVASIIAAEKMEKKPGAVRKVSPGQVCEAGLFLCPEMGVCVPKGACESTP